MPKQGKPAEMRWSGNYCYCFGRGRGFKSRHPDSKTAGQRLCAIESLWPRVTNCVTIRSLVSGAALPLRRSRRFTVVIIYRSRLRVTRLGDDRDAKLATLLHPASCRNRQVRALNINRAGVKRRCPRGDPPSGVAILV